MNAVAQASHVEELHRELHQLMDEEREGLVQFLLRLDAFDREQGWALKAYPSLWAYLTRELHIREASTGRRIQAMKLLRRWPRLAAPLRDGSLCLSTLGELSKVLTDENLDEVVARAANLSFRETQELVVSIQPRSIPREGIRRLPEQLLPVSVPQVWRAPHDPVSVPTPEPSEAPLLLAAPEPPRHSGRIQPIAKGRWNVSWNLDEEGKAQIETFLALTSHKNPRGDIATAMREAIRCGILVHGKRRGAVRPERTRRAPEPIPRPRGERDPIPADEKRKVWERDGGQCTYRSPEGKRCESRWQLEFHHRHGALVTGSTAEDLGLRCKPHNVYDAVQVFGREHVEKAIARRRRSRQGAVTTDVGSAPWVKSGRPESRSEPPVANLVPRSPPPVTPVAPPPPST